MVYSAVCVINKYNGFFFKKKIYYLKPSCPGELRLLQILKCDSSHSTGVRDCPGTQLWKATELDADKTKVHTARDLVHIVKNIGKVGTW